MKHSPLGVLTGYVYPWEIRPEFSRFECGSLDANDCIASGSTSKIYYGDKQYEAPVTAIAFRFLDAYDYTDRTARVTDCASEGM